jgi:hypothetical protein
MNKKNEKIKKLWDKGERDIVRIAHKLGYTGNSTNLGIERVKEGIQVMKLH